MTYEEAMTEVVNLRNQGLTYPAIEKRLKKAGYVSPHSNRPVGSLAVRAMVNRATGAKATPRVSATAVGPKTLPQADLLEVIGAVVEAPDLSPDLRLDAIRRLIKAGRV